MLKSLVITNYAIINQLEIDFDNGLNIITGETGAGKSIILGALSLLLGQRADSSVLKNNDKKCVIEGYFNIEKYNLKNFFDENDLDFEIQTIIRREVSDNGKSRAFINDIPVNLNTLKELGIQLIDIHSQHQNLNLQNNDFQIKVVDILADNLEILKSYNVELKLFHHLKNKITEVKEETELLKKEKDFLEFQYSELESAALKDNELEELEIEYNKLTHAEEIKELLSGSINLIAESEINILSNLKSVLNNLQKLKQIDPQNESFYSRLESVYIEVKDVNSEIVIINEKNLIDPERAEFVNSRLNLLYTLQQKHQVKSIGELIGKKEEFKSKLDNIFFSDEKIKQLEIEIDEQFNKVKELAKQISQNRQNVIPTIESEINRLLGELGMKSSTFKIKIEEDKNYTSNGCDEVRFLYSPGKDIAFLDLAKTVSGGEISRLMLSIKSLITKYIDLPTIVFDEIDTGISGEVADMMGNIIKRMSKSMQVINITHLPQVASKGDNHYLVHKINKDNTTETRMKLLSNDERITEVAKMLSGAELTEAAIQNAKELLKG